MAKRGRKPKGEYSGKSLVFSTRITPQLRKALEKAANSSGRSVSQEVEHRLTRSFVEDESIVDLFGSRQTYRLMRMMADAVHLAGNGDEPVDWLKDPVAFRFGKAAIAAVLEYVAPLEEGDNSTIEPLLQGLAEARAGIKAKQLWEGVRSADAASPRDKGTTQESRNAVAKADLVALLDRTMRDVHDERLQKQLDVLKSEAELVRVEMRAIRDEAHEQIDKNGKK